MTQQQEKLSAFMDGEIEGNDIIDAIKNDEALQAKWKRYHVYRGAMRKEVSVAPQLDITASVAAALESEPAIVAPKRSRWSSIPLIGNVVPFAKQSGQFAVAASVAVAVIFGVQYTNQDSPAEPFMTAPTIAPQGGLAPVSLEQTRMLPRNDMNEVLEKKRKINALIADHEQQIKLKQAQEEEIETSEQQRP
ncbi:anti-sigma-E factor RseA [Alteromonas sp. KUL156]|uniref:sigma-E factor negative regulatory protein n=1 Tax=Alteromonas sp. KUL106 TaxID=2480799 RepID=UPI0012E6A959|nr:RseA family anti-sigma factor [Alteromonas sp. KUL106]GFD70204.1 anti-sigma-E factor RseA [Alteromonas sp. KUL106]GFD96733.1 anti-sigma-E factor RseA [Alteromonas sp. KUL154]GFD99475.1 anti-sigma-E factor RseA [Alteromonas sp. KUL156]